MNILILGGTQFLGRHFVEIALEQGHQVTLFNRGQTHSDLYPEVEKLIGNRVEGDLTALQGRRWDIVIDTAGYFPKLAQVVQETAELLQNSVSQYIFISTISVYAELSINGDETLPLYHKISDSAAETDGTVYGTEKAEAEAVVQNFYGSRGLIVRPGLIVGPYDPTGRFTYWVRRVAQGGEILVPESSELPVQVIDARDLVQWIYHMVSQGEGGIYNAVGPDYPLTLGQVLEACQSVSKSPIQLTWIPGAFLAAQGVEYWQELPLWLPPSLQNTFVCLSNQKALQAGLRFRPLTETIDDILQWDAIAPLHYSSVLSADKETAILQTWQKNMTIENLEDKLRQAMLTSDVAVLDELIADDLVWTMHTGLVVNKQFDLEAHRSGIFKFTQLDISDRQIHLYGDCAVVTLKVEAAGILSDQDFSETYRFTRVWVQRQNRWKIVAGHVSQLIPV